MVGTSGGKFPAVGSTLGPYFCLGQLGKGTFSSIHKCINLAYHQTKKKQNRGIDHSSGAAEGVFSGSNQITGSNVKQQEGSSTTLHGAGLSSVPRLAAAKVELTTFAQSGVLESEATILDFLHQNLPPNTVPVYMGHYRSITTAENDSAASSSSSPLPSSLAAVAPSSAMFNNETAVSAPGPLTGVAEPSQPQQQESKEEPSLIAAALVMEFLPGSDMHQLREKVMAGRTSRRIALEDAIMLTADVMLPLLQRMHNVGIIHRDVKPSNCVLRSSSPPPPPNQEQQKRRGEDTVPDFCMVDFGLSKSILVGEDSLSADREHHWKGGDSWLKPRGYKGKACYRKERERAEFRGTSMYASPRVHQLRDYCPRDDMYSLMYVFCDLVSGGLPWMSYAAIRDRTMCQMLKERIHGDGTPDGADETEQLLMGDEYHVAKFRLGQRQKQMEKRQQAQETAIASGSGELPEPLSMCKDPRRVGLLRDVFKHLSTLNFWDIPNYDFIQQSIRSFAGNDQFKPPPIPRIDYNIEQQFAERWRSNLLAANRNMPKGCIPDDSDPLEEDVFDELENDASDRSELTVLPAELRFRLAQMEYHASKPELVPPAVALRDWMKVTLPLIYGTWDTVKYEGRHRTSTDGLKRDLYLNLLLRCDRWSKKFGNFRDRKFHDEEEDEDPPADPLSLSGRSGDPRRTNVMSEPDSKRRKILDVSTTWGARANVSRALCGLRLAIDEEQGKKSAALATQLSFT